MMFAEKLFQYHIVFAAHRLRHCNKRGFHGLHHEGSARLRRKNQTQNSSISYRIALNNKLQRKEHRAWRQRVQDSFWLTVKKLVSSVYSYAKVDSILSQLLRDNTEGQELYQERKNPKLESIISADCCCSSISFEWDFVQVNSIQIV